ncbi:hypothetical protein EVAR_17107_1 [Eumeta japonica]|uniref:Uncharacterized protein n=1 Tax=Eumeta variegata TaxID=151549 RepID=A0A4C1UMT5_EUMVA|nr:hypothetical protein EVAR_17107_1 [Eumeta japonica]
MLVQLQLEKKIGEFPYEDAHADTRERHSDKLKFQTNALQNEASSSRRLTYGQDVYKLVCLCVRRLIAVALKMKQSSSGGATQFPSPRDRVIYVDTYNLRVK